MIYTQTSGIYYWTIWNKAPIQVNGGFIKFYVLFGRHSGEQNIYLLSQDKKLKLHSSFSPTSTNDISKISEAAILKYYVSAPEFNNVFYAEGEDTKKVYFNGDMYSGNLECILMITIVVILVFLWGACLFVLFCQKYFS